MNAARFSLNYLRGVIVHVDYFPWAGWTVDILQNGEVLRYRSSDAAACQRVLLGQHDKSDPKQMYGFGLTEVDAYLALIREQALKFPALWELMPGSMRPFDDV